MLYFDDSIRHLNPELRRVERKQHEEEKLPREAEAREGLELVPEEQVPGDAVPHKNDGEERKEVQQVRESGADGARHQGHAGLEVQSLEDAQDEEDHWRVSGPKAPAESHGVA